PAPEEADVALAPILVIGELERVFQTPGHLNRTAARPIVSPAVDDSCLPDPELCAGVRLGLEAHFTGHRRLDLAEPEGRPTPAAARIVVPAVVDPLDLNRVLGARQVNVVKPEADQTGAGSIGLVCRGRRFEQGPEGRADR